jgi:hypothetical protein
MQPDGSQYAQHEAPPTVRSLAIPSSIQLKMSGDFVQCSSTQLPLHEAQILISGASHAQIGALMSDMRMGVIDGAPWLLTSVEQRRSSGAMSVRQKLPCSRFFSRCRDLRPIASPPTCCDSVVEPVAGRIRRPSRRNDTPGAKRLRVRIRPGRRLLSQGHRVHSPTPRGLPAWTRWRCLECERRFRPSRHRCRPRLKRDRQSWSSAPCG